MNVRPALPLAVALLAAPLAAQAPQTLGRLVWTSPVEFTSVASVRELSDGRLIVPDPGERVIRLLDPRGAPLGTIGRQGGGPREFQIALWTLAMPGDTTWVVDREQERFLVIGPDGTALRTVPWPRIDGSGLRNVVQADGRGHLVFAQDAFPRPGLTETPLLRWDPPSGKLDTLATLRTPGVVRYKVTYEGREADVTRALPFAEGDGWAVARDGSVAVFDPARYVVRWRHPDGRIETGRPIPFTPAPIRQADRDRYLEGENAATRAHLTFPDQLPAVHGYGAQISPTGELWTWRYVPSPTSGPTWDVIDRTGRRVRSVELPPSREIVGFGAHLIYVVYMDADEMLHLEAYR